VRVHPRVGHGARVVRRADCDRLRVIVVHVARWRRTVAGLELLTAGHLDAAFAHYEEIANRSRDHGTRRLAVVMLGYIENVAGDGAYAAADHSKPSTLPTRLRREAAATKVGRPVTLSGREHAADSD
jgi:hypothetical protein